MNHAGADSTCPQITDVSIPNFGTEVKSAVKTLNIAHDVRVAVRVAPMSTSEDISLVDCRVAPMSTSEDTSLVDCF